MNYYKGFSVVEILVVIAILSILSVGSILTFGGFAHQTKLERSVSELAATLRTARTKSISGELLTGTTISDYFGAGDYSSKLPIWGVRFLNTHEYDLVTSYTAADGTVYTNYDVENHEVDESLDVTSTSAIPFTILFARSTGSTTTTAITVARGNYEGKIITVRINGTFTTTAL